MKRVYVNEKWCLGCHLCEYNCAFANSGESDMAKALRGKVIHPRIHIEEQGEIHYAVSCRHCSDPLCVRSCISGALSIQDGTVKIDRKNAGSRKAIVHQRRCFVRESMDGHIRLRIILDRYSFEVFINDGRYVMSAVIPTELSAQKIVFRAEGKAIIDVTKREIRF